MNDLKLALSAVAIGTAAAFFVAWLLVEALA